MATPVGSGPGGAVEGTASQMMALAAMAAMDKNKEKAYSTSVMVLEPSAEIFTAMRNAVLGPDYAGAGMDPHVFFSFFFPTESCTPFDLSARSQQHSSQGGRKGDRGDEAGTGKRGSKTSSEPLVMLANPNAVPKCRADEPIPSRTCKLLPYTYNAPVDDFSMSGKWANHACKVIKLDRTPFHHTEFMYGRTLY